MQPAYHAQPRRDIPGEDPQIARLSAMVVALLQELAITRERLDTVERLLDAAGVVGRDEVDGYVPDAAAGAERDTLRQRTIKVVMQPLKADAERAREAAERAGASRSASQDEADAILDRELIR